MSVIAKYDNVTILAGVQTQLGSVVTDEDLDEMILIAIENTNARRHDLVAVTAPDPNVVGGVLLSALNHGPPFSGRLLFKV